MPPMAEPRFFRLREVGSVWRSKRTGSAASKRPHRTAIEARLPALVLRACAAVGLPRRLVAPRLSAPSGGGRGRSVGARQGCRCACPSGRGVRYPVRWRQRPTSWRWSRRSTAVGSPTSPCSRWVWPTGAPRQRRSGRRSASPEGSLEVISEKLERGTLAAGSLGLRFPSPGGLGLASLVWPPCAEARAPRE